MKRLLNLPHRLLAASGTPTWVRLRALPLAITTIAMGLAATPAARAEEPPYISNFTKVSIKTSCKCGTETRQIEVEPSGIVWDGANSLYAVGDNGVIAQRSRSAAPAADWNCLYYWCGDPTDHQGHAWNDFESVAFLGPSILGTDASALYVGIEGTAQSMTEEEDHSRTGDPLVPTSQTEIATCKDFCLKDPRCVAYDFQKPSQMENKSKKGTCTLLNQKPKPVKAAGHVTGVKKGVTVRPSIRQFEIRSPLSASRFTSYLWELGDICVSDGSGVESMTFVPARVPGGPQHPSLAGYFLASSQTACHGKGSGEVFAYLLPGKPVSGQRYKSASSFYLQDQGSMALTVRNSDFYYSQDSCLLYVTYDHEKGDTEGSNFLRQFATQEPGLLQTLAVQPPVPYLFKLETKLEADVVKPPSKQPTTYRMLGAEAVTAVKLDPATPPKVNLYLGYDMSPGQQRSLEEAGKQADGSYLLSSMVGYSENQIRPQSQGCACTTITACSAIAGTDCGWCADNQLAWSGNDDLPNVGTCARWFWKHADCDCAAITACGQVSGHKNCGWCVGVGTLPADEKTKQPKVARACPPGHQWLYNPKPKECPST